MRIVGGEFKGRIFSPPKNFDARPTTDFAKESLFNIINNHFDFSDLRVLDLFAGTGSIGFEFASRGAQIIDSVEQSYVHHKFIKETAAKLKIGNYSAFRSDVFAFIGRCPRSYNFIFADPPYNLEGIDKLPDLIVQGKFLENNGMFILEHSSKYSFGNHLSFVEHRNYGSVNFSFFEKNMG